MFQKLIDSRLPKIGLFSSFVRFCQEDHVLRMWCSLSPSISVIRWLSRNQQVISGWERRKRQTQTKGKRHMHSPLMIRMMMMMTMTMLTTTEEMQETDTRKEGKEGREGDFWVLGCTRKTFLSQFRRITRKEEGGSRIKKMLYMGN